MAGYPGPFRRIAGFTLFGSIVALLSVGACGKDAATPTGQDESRLPGNRNPQLARQIDTQVDTGDTLRVQARASDPDGDVVRYSVLVVPTPAEIESGRRPSVTMDSATGWFSFAPTLADAPWRTVVFYADDGMGGRDSTRFVVDVKDKQIGAPN